MSETYTLEGYLGDDFQLKCLWQLITEPEFAEKTIPLLEISYFDDATYKRFFSVIRQYIDTFGSPPNLQNRSILAAIRKFNKNVVVLPNAIDPNEPQFQSKPTESDRIRIGFLGGSTHLEDLSLMNGVPNVFLPVRDKIQMVLVGFDLRGKIKKQLENGKVESRDMKPEETIWYEYEKLFTSNGQLLSEHPDYVRFLKLYEQKKYEGEEDMPYRRIWTREINSYAHNYNHLDISLAPLVENKFNLFKSQLKIVEAGFHKKALIAQNFGAYTLDLTNVFDGNKINPKGNSILIDSRKNHKQWTQALKRLIDNPEIIQMMGENLNEMVVDRFDLNKVTKDRAEFYRSII